MANGNRYVEAARRDVETLKREFDALRERASGSGRTESDLADTAWNDLQEQWQKLEAAGDTASTELQNAFEDARLRARRVLDSYRSG